MNNAQIISTINRITDGDNITLDDAFAHLAHINGKTADEVESIYVEGRA